MRHTRTVVDGYCQVRGLKMAGREAFLRLELGLGNRMLFCSRLSTIRQSVFMP